jgi:hypothetical protein
VQDLTIALPQNAADETTGLMTNNAARRIEVIEDPIRRTIARESNSNTAPRSKTRR